MATQGWWVCVGVLFYEGILRFAGSRSPNPDLSTWQVSNKKDMSNFAAKKEDATARRLLLRDMHLRVRNGHKLVMWNLRRGAAIS